jgi:hypothetical protein
VVLSIILNVYRENKGSLEAHHLVESQFGLLVRAILLLFL